ncbi:hypothetical protein STRCR_0156 [Streptococcus criceti HS-6]|uniref:Uncharacterized protein n=1 Tax=Streptococcus criceti HS-6 TaxID=873449 RepID=G5JNB9_STRCG|nr:hypothetical protein STRCR_0156 [Streptococcus criceti HS-6]
MSCLTIKLSIMEQKTSNSIVSPIIVLGEAERKRFDLFLDKSGKDV